MASHNTHRRIAAAMVAGALSLAGTGCGRKTVHAAPPVMAAPAPEAERPMNTAPDTSASPPKGSDTIPPAIPVTTAAPPPVTIPSAKPTPPPRRPVAEQPAAEPAEQPRPQAPQLTPQISPSDQESYRRKTDEDVSVAEKNLQQTAGKQLNAAQQDLVGKIRSFLDQSREASKDGDWARAQNLAQKARLLSVELANSL